MRRRLTTTMRLSWQDRVHLASSGDNFVVVSLGTRIVVRSTSPEIAHAMRRLTPPGEDEERLAESILATANASTLARWYFHVDQFHLRGLIRRTLDVDGRVLATHCPFSETTFKSKSVLRSNRSHHSRCESATGDRNRISSYVVSRFAFIRRDQAEFVIESPLSHGRVVLHDPGLMSIVGLLTAPCTMSRVTEQASKLVLHLTSEDIRAFVRMLVDVGIVNEVDNMTDAVEQDRPELATWEFHDLLFHARSRRGRWDGGFGGTYRFPDRPAPPAIQSVTHGESIELYRPEMEQLERDDPPLAAVQNHRRSERRYGDQPLTAEQVGEFLYRVARVTEVRRMSVPANPEPHTIEMAMRPYPSGGALYELDFYLVIQVCEGLSPGLCHYDPIGHRLERVDRSPDSISSLLQDAADSSGMAKEDLQVVIILTSRFERLAWKYESIAYSLTLKHVGVVYQTMYLAATAMGLAPCALGCGDSDLFAQVAGTEYCVETSVGEFLLGSRFSEAETEGVRK